MNLNSFRTRLGILVVAATVLVLAVALLARRTWDEAVGVRQHFRTVQEESARLERQVQADVEALDVNLFRFKLRHDPARWATFNRIADDLRAWLRARVAETHTAAETQALRNLATELGAYLDAARRFAEAGKPGQPALSPRAEDDLVAEITERSDDLVGYGVDLASAHNATLNDTFASADRALGHIEWSTFAALGLLVATGAGTGWLVFRDFIGPLQQDLQESRRRLAHQEKLAALGVLSAGIAHEIRNPLTAVKARLFTLRKAVRQDAGALQDVNVANAEVDRLERIVRTFLKFARPPEPELARVAPADVLRRVQSVVEPTCAAAGVRLDVDLTPAPAMRADADQVEQVLLNLVQNATEAMPGGGTVQLRARDQAQREGRFVAIEVVDTGPGIAPEVQARLFDPFFTTKPTGTGLGLALSARMVEKHGGSIRVHTALQRGTTFTVLLPAADPS